MENNIGYYLALLALILIGFIVVKKVASCMIKSVVGIILILAAAAIYWLYLK